MDTIGDFCTILRNAISAGKSKADVPTSKIRAGIAEKLKTSGYIRGYKIAENGVQGVMRVYLKYDEKQSSCITAIQRVSKPSCRRYVKVNNIPEIRSGYGLAILSTSHGILTDAEARKENVGGEVLCQIW